MLGRLRVSTAFTGDGDARLIAGTDSRGDEPRRGSVRDGVPVGAGSDAVQESFPGAGSVTLDVVSELAVVTAGSLTERMGRASRQAMTATVDSRTAAATQPTRLPFFSTAGWRGPTAAAIADKHGQQQEA